MNKRAQFFIIAALILSGIILTLGRAYTSSKIEQDNLQVYDLSNEIQYETSQVIDNGIFNQETLADIKQDIENLTAYYSSLNPDSNILILYGNSSDISLIEYNLSSKTIVESAINTSEILSKTSPSTSFKLDNQQIKVKIISPPQNPSSSVLQEVEHSLIMNGQQVFYVVVRNKARGQDVVVYR
ncbi:MAG: hypothetical protein AABX66_03805 [Nanoarchaeota archaeon]